MNKIYTGIVTLVALVALVSSTAYAAFNSNVTFTGVTLGAATAGLSVEIAGDIFTGTVPIDDTVDTLVPGEIKTAPFKLNNTGDVDFNLYVQTGAIGGTTALGDLIKVQISTADDAHTSGWYTLNQLQTKRSLNDVVLGADSSRNYKVSYYLDGSAPDSVAGTDIIFNISLLGEQSL